MRQKLFSSVIPVDVYYGFWTSNAVSNKGQDPGPPRPIVSYADRMGAARDMPLMTWRAGGYECWGAVVAHEQRAKDQCKLARNSARCCSKRKRG